MKKNRPAILLFMLSLLALLIVIYVTVSPKLRDDGAVTEETDALLADFKPGDMTAMTYTNGEATISLVYDGLWYLDGDRQFPVRQERASAMSSAASRITMKRKFEPGEVSDEDTGLNDPAYTITVSYKSGDRKTYYIGNYNSFNGCYYFAVDGDDSVYMIPSGLSSAFDYSLLELAEYDKLPKLAVGDIKSYDVVKPAASYNVTDTEMLEKITALYFDDCVAYKPDEDLLESYGLGSGAPTITVHYTVVKNIATEESSVSQTAGIPVDYDMTFTVGSVSEDDDTVRYVRFNDSPLIYTMDADTMEQLLGIE